MSPCGYDKSASVAEICNGHARIWKGRSPSNMVRDWSDRSIDLIELAPPGSPGLSNTRP